ncbi:PEP-utilizing enzyme, partial [Chromobacterium phragmitis]|uniref:PEP-utilizing enzyme n=1 Tax=Chromobacterium phragmitis TaxID=2202141 RepID=UPI0032664800
MMALHSVNDEASLVKSSGHVAILARSLGIPALVACGPSALAPPAAVMMPATLPRGSRVSADGAK